MSAQSKGRRVIDASGAAAMLVLTGAAYFLVVDPALQAQRRLVMERAESSEAAAKADQAANELTDAQRQLVQLEREVDTIAVELRTPASINRQIDRLTGLAERSSVKLTRIFPQQSWSNQWFTAVPITMSGTGSFSAVSGFLQHVREECPDVSVRGLKIVGQPPTQDKPAPTSTPSSENEPASAASLTTIDIEFVWFAAPEGTAGVVTTK